MQIEPRFVRNQPPEQPDRPDPAGFVMSVALTLFVLTLVSVFTMHYAAQYGWQIL